MCQVQRSDHYRNKQATALQEQNEIQYNALYLFSVVTSVLVITFYAITCQ